MATKLEQELISALKYTRERLRDMTTREFELGGDKDIRDRLDAVIDQLNVSVDEYNQQRPKAMTPQQFIADAQQRKDAAWTFYRVMSAADHKALDQWLVDTKHPLAYKPGTTWDRFQALVRP